MNFILFDDERYFDFLPLTHTRPVSELRCGIQTMREKWQAILQQPLYYKTQNFLQEKFPLHLAEENLFINAGLFPTVELVEAIMQLKLGESLLKEKTLLATRIDQKSGDTFDVNDVLSNTNCIAFQSDIKSLQNLWDIFSLNDWAIRDDFERMTKGRISQAISDTNTVIGNQLFVEEGAMIEGAIINTKTGPVYIGRDAEVMEGSLIRGPFALGDYAVLKMGAKIYGATTIGERCKIGGEVNNSVFFANSNKAHDGFIGNAVIGEWCNIGADSNNSNLKNNYAEVKLWNYEKERFVLTGLTFCGLIMADHSKCGINTMFNTGTVVGVNANIFGAGFPRNFIPDFSWGGAAGFTTYKTKDAFEVALRVFERRGMIFNETERKILSHIFELTEKYRK